MRDLFVLACGNHPKWAELSEDQRMSIVRRMERNCFEVTLTSCVEDGIDRLFSEKKFVERYSANCSRVISNIDNNNSGYLLDQIISGDISAYKVAELSASELCPMASAKEREEIKSRQSQTYDRKISTKHKCNKCGKSATTPLEYQGRAADETSSHSHKCINCGNIWRT